MVMDFRKGDELHDEIDALKADLAQCRELSELRLQSEQKLIVERDVLRGQVVMLEMHLENHDRLRAALEEIDAIVANTPGDFGPMTALNRISNIARRALEGK
jgi:hypothetical protein